MFCLVLLCSPFIRCATVACLSFRQFRKNGRVLRQMSFPLQAPAMGTPESSSLDIWSTFIEPYEVGFCALVVAGVYLFVKFRRRHPVESHNLPLREFAKGHNFCLTDLFAHPSYCNLCEESVVEGFCCDACGIVSHPNCAHLAHKKIRCKAMSSFGAEMKHHLVRGM